MAERTKEREQEYEQKLNYNEPFVVRLDGVAFRTFTREMKKPFDSRMTNSLVKTTMDLVDRFGATTGFCQSDEISLVFANEEGSTPLYNNRILKIVSVLASFASARFNSHVSSYGFKSDSAIFDARAFSTDYSGAVDAIAWRHSYDCRRNAIQMIGHCLFAHRELQNVPLNALVDRIRAMGFDPYSDFPMPNIFGVFVKKAIVEHLGFNPITQQHVKSMRLKVQPRVFDWNCPFEKKLKMIQAKFWEEDDPQSVSSPFVEIE